MVAGTINCTGADYAEYENQPEDLSWLEGQRVLVYDGKAVGYCDCIGGKLVPKNVYYLPVPGSLNIDPMPFELYVSRFWGN